MSLIDSVGESLSSWFGSGETETKEKSALTTFATERFKLIDTNIQEGSLGHKLKKAKVVLILDEINSPLISEFLENQFSENAKLVTSYRVWWSLRSPFSIFSSEKYSNYKHPTNPLSVVNSKLERLLFPSLLISTYAQTDDEIHIPDENLAELLPALGLTPEKPLADQSQEERFKLNQALISAIVAKALQEVRNYDEEYANNEIQNQTNGTKEKIEIALKHSSKAFVVMNEFAGRYINANPQNISAVQSLYQHFLDNNISFVTLKVRKQLGAEPSQREKEGLSLNDPSRIEQKIEKRNAKLENRKIAFLQLLEAAIQKNWSLYNQAQSLIELAFKVEETPLHTTTLEFISKTVESWKLPQV